MDFQVHEHQLPLFFPTHFYQIRLLILSKCRNARDSQFLDTVHAATISTNRGMPQTAHKKKISSNLQRRALQKATGIEKIKKNKKICNNTQSNLAMKERKSLEAIATKWSKYQLERRGHR